MKGHQEEKLGTRCLIMGCTLSADEVRSNQIDQMLRREGEKQAKEVKLLLLGSHCIIRDILFSFSCGSKYEYVINIFRCWRIREKYDSETDEVSRLLCMHTLGYRVLTAVELFMRLATQKKNVCSINQ